MKVETIEGTIKMKDGSEHKFLLSGEKFWSQWGASGSELGKTVDLMEALAEAAYEHIDQGDEEEGGWCGCGAALDLPETECEECKG